jgi:hypothetical protein
MRAEIRPSTAEDFVAFKGRLPPYRCRSFTGTVGGKIMGIGGIAYLPDGTALAFLELEPGAHRYAVTLHKAAKRVIEEAQSRGIPCMIAEADPKEPTAQRWLSKLGFKPQQIDNETVWIWQP